MLDLFTAVTGDMVRSRKAPQRPALAKRLDAALRELGRYFAEDWIAPLKVTRGIDELSGVLRSTERAFDVAARLNRLVWPQRFRFGVAQGEIDIGLETKDAGAMDGPAFHEAAKELDRAHKEGLPLAVNLVGWTPGEIRVLEALARTHSVIVGRWSRAQWIAVCETETVGTQSRAASRLQITQQAVSEALKSASWKEVAVAEEAARRWLGERR
jgi:hypothetical protein